MVQILFSGSDKGSEVQKDDCGAFVSFAEIIARRAVEAPNDVAVPHPEGNISFGRLDKRANQVANALHDSGISRGDRVAFLGTTSTRSLELLTGAARIGAIFVPIIWRLNESAIQAIIKDCRTRLLFVDPVFQSKLAKSELSAGSIILMSDRADHEHRAFDSWRAAASIEAPTHRAHADDPVLQLYAQGVNEQPRSLIVTHANGGLVMKSIVALPSRTRRQ